MSHNLGIAGRGEHDRHARAAQASSPATRDFQDVVAFLAQQMAKTPIRRLMRIAWDSVGDIVARVVADHFDESRLYGLVLISVDEISYRRGQRYLTCVAEHQRGRIVWAKPGRDAKTLEAFSSCSATDATRSRRSRST